MTDPAGFFADVYPDAKIAAAQTGVPISVILAQWADETGYGTSKAWLTGHNYAGVSPSGSPASYPDRTTGLAAYIKTLMLGPYASVRSAGDPTAAATALGASPWAAGHYSARGAGPGSDLLAIMGSNDLTRYDGASSAGGGAASATAVSWWNPTTWFSSAGNAVERLVVSGVLIAGGLALVVAGGWRSVAPVVKPKIDQAKSAAALAGKVAIA